MTVMANLASVLARSALGVFGTLVSPRLSILIFHRVHPKPDPLFPHEPDAARFDAMMRYVSSTYRVLTLGEAVEHLNRDTLAPRSLVITFDDGYADNAEVALPILQRHGLRATFFVSTGFLDGGRMWNDSVIECVRSCGHGLVDLGVFGLERFSLNTPAERTTVIDLLLPRIKYLSLSGREEAISSLQKICGVATLPADLMMASDQVRDLHRSGMEIGAHTVNHPILTSIALPEAECEISDGKRGLESIIDAPVDVFAYPNGKPDQDYDYSHVAMVKKLGFRGAVSTAPGVAKSGSDLYQLPRFTPWGKSIGVWGARLALNQSNYRCLKAAVSVDASIDMSRKNGGQGFKGSDELT